MKFLQHKNTSTAGLLGLAMAGALFSSLLGFALVSGNTFAGTDSGETTNDDDDGGGTDGPSRRKGPGAFNPDEEAVGTLPTIGKKEKLPKLPPNPGIFLRGPREAIHGGVISATGSGFATVESLPNGTDIEVVFHGEADLELDGNLFQVTGVTIGVAALDPIYTTQATAMTEDTLLLNASLSVGGSLGLPIDEFQQTGALHEGIHVLTSSLLLGRDAIDIEALGGLILIEQGGPLGL